MDKYSLLRIVCDCFTSQLQLLVNQLISGYLLRCYSYLPFKLCILMMQKFSM
uniref:Uncharacterized protein n=1 Tax=Rhizophora mucronata TaxID=61149 RepID=A0A2P2P8X8_RHIMU